MSSKESDLRALDQALTAAAAALLDEIRLEPVPETITRLAAQLQAALDHKVNEKVEILPKTPGHVK